MTAGPQPTLTGRTVRLRPWRPDDVDAVCAACQDTEIQRWTEVPVAERRSPSSRSTAMRSSAR